MQKKNLWLDDIRLPPDETYFWAKTAHEAIEFLKSSKDVEHVSLDHDVIWEPWMTADDGWEDRNTGYAVVLWMRNNNKWPKYRVQVHSSNAEGKMRMLIVLWKHYKQNVDVESLQQGHKLS